MNCPRCNQGEVLKAKVKKNAMMIFICNECEAIWFDESSINAITFNYFNIFMERIGLIDDWNELAIME